MKTWHAAKSSSNGQGLVIDDADGRNVAVTYDEKDAPLVAAAPDLLAALVRARDHVIMAGTLSDDRPATLAQINEAINKAKGQS